MRPAPGAGEGAGGHLRTDMGIAQYIDHEQ